MSQPRLIYPLLEGFYLGDAISEHDGIRCYPAIRQNDGEKCIVKVISFPASQVQLDALLLTGAFSGKDSALEYFKELATDKAEEAQILQQLSLQEGFTPYHSCQIVASQDGSGYELYLLGSFKKSLDKIFAANGMTQRGVVEMGLDLCAALAACRRAGHLYLDLKPSNVFYTEEEGYRIGDLGFSQLSSLQFSSLPTAMRSVYSAPELLDDFAVLNDTVDIYALGLVLYQACNGGALPGDLSVPPMYADYELAAIITKACHPDPQQRYPDPTQMAQALIGYMQQVGVNDLPLIPEMPEEEIAEVEEFLPEATAEELAEEMAMLIPEDALMETMAAADEAEEAQADLDQILAQADDLIAHPTPEAQVIQTPVTIPEPEPIATEPETEPAVAEEPVLEEEIPEITEIPESTAEEIEEVPEPEAEIPPEPEQKEPKIRKSFPWKILLGVLLIALICFGCAQARQYYQQVYIQQIDDLALSLENGQIIVKITSNADETLLRVSCSDSYGNVQYSAVTAGIATFQNLQPKTRYTIRVQIEGNHKLMGNTTGSIATPEQTEVLTFTACIGAYDGSVLLTLTSRGPAVPEWTLTYYGDGIAPTTTRFAGNQVTVTGLHVGTDYIFELSAEGQTIGGQTQVHYVASDIILAQDLAITACGGGKLTVQWSSPEGYVATNGWAVRCYDGTGYDQSIITYEPWFTFAGLDHSTDCTVEVTAVGMYQSVSATIAADPITVEKFDFTVSMNAGLVVNWTFSGSAPEEGWLVRYDIDGLAYEMTTTENSIRVYSLPGVTYNFTVQPLSERAYFGGETTFSLTEVGSFSGYGIPADSLHATFVNPTLTLHTLEETIVESSEDSIAVLFILRSGEGQLIAALETACLWNEIWNGNLGVLNVPNIPATPGTYQVSIYFNGGWVADVTFLVE